MTLLRTTHACTLYRCAFERGEPLPHILIHGVAGSGKTLLAQRFASMCGLKYAVVSGGDVGPLGSNASYELGRLMRWAGAGTAEGGAARGAGTALVLDGAEAVLGNRR